MKFLDIEGVKQIKQYVDGKFVTIEDHNDTEQVTSAALNDLNNRILNIENKQGTSNESDPIFSSSVAAEITSNDIINWNSKTNNIGTITQINIGSTEYTPSDGIVSLPTYPTTLPASDVSSWAKASTKPSYTASEVGAATQSDINTAIQNLIGTAPETLNTLGEIADALNDDANLASTLTNQISAKYTKPSTGIPKGDLASTVQASLNKADTALQSYTETDPTVPAWAKAANKPTYTAAEVGALPSTTVIPTVNNGTLTIQKNGTNVQTFTANQSSNVTANIQVNEVPSYSSSNNGQILMVVNGALAWVSPTVIYSGSATPSNSIGNNGDVYLQS